jgi:hypothetical protein
MEDRFNQYLITNFLSTVDTSLHRFLHVINANRDAEFYGLSHEELKQMLDGIDEIYDNVDCKIKII